MPLTDQAKFFVKEKPVMAVLAIHKSYSEIYPSKVSKQIDSTYSHTVNIIAKMEEYGIVQTERDGRKRILTLTDMGKAYSNTLLDLMEIEGEEIEFADRGKSLDFLKDKDKARSTRDSQDSNLAQKFESMG